MPRRKPSPYLKDKNYKILAELLAPNGTFLLWIREVQKHYKINLDPQNFIIRTSDEGSKFLSEGGRKKIFENQKRFLSQAPRWEISEIINEILEKFNLWPAWAPYIVDMIASNFFDVPPDDLESNKRIKYRGSDKFFDAMGNLHRIHRNKVIVGDEAFENMTEYQKIISKSKEYSEMKKKKIIKDNLRGQDKKRKIPKPISKRTDEEAIERGFPNLKKPEKHNLLIRNKKFRERMKTKRLFNI